jgi:hypothetical protein
LVKEIQAMYKSEYQNQYVDWSSTFESVKQSVQQGPSVEKNKVEKQAVSRPKSGLLQVLPKPNREPVDYMQVQSIYQTMNHPEKRHYALPTTFDLTQSVSERAASRQANT